jgi:hypothetical protein
MNESIQRLRAQARQLSRGKTPRAPAAPPPAAGHADSGARAHGPTKAYLLQAVRAALATPGTITLPHTPRA